MSKIEGGEALVRDLQAVETKVAGKFVRQALRAGAKIIQAQCKADAPNRSGLTRRSIKVRAGRRSRTGVKMLVSIGKQAYVGDNFYAAFQNFGWKAGSRKNKGYRRPITTKNFDWLGRAFDKSAKSAEAKVREVLAAKLAEGKGGGDGAE